uniref:ATPase/GTPase, AAA15 family n=1 Tax=Candidatus Kentrum sp. TC TaxID=2126339 RepID=A0A450YEA0_9GAMM|nr:MAG: ATPase/GTPase, AAA15 family [Candidatus Kentron sp. TC]VFK54158.1 MAG: ATPase/GTPase, AAA15 family [Candidatus Kentron sp. TC]
MINSFEAKNFRLFDKVKIDRLNRVNLIVGKNNAGKTALLEALLLYLSRMSVEVIPKFLDARQEYWLPEQPYGGKSSSPLMHFFKGHKIPNLDEEGFRLSSNEEDPIHVGTGAYLQEDPADLKRLVGIGRKNTMVGQGVNTRKYQFVSARGISDEESSSLWDRISLTDLEEDLLKGLRIIEPELLGLTFVRIDHDVEHHYRAPSRIPLVRPNRVSDPVPLKSLGDGMIRIFHIILSLVSAKGGILLIDEFENGLHWEIQEKAWRIVFELAEKLDVQVFATTHSRDCIAGFSKVWQENAEKGAFIRIAKDHYKTVITEYDTELLSDSLEMDTEVR